MSSISLKILRFRSLDSGCEEYIAELGPSKVQIDTKCVKVNGPWSAFE